jgi:hypothetical protein
MEALRHGLSSAVVAGLGETHAIHEPDEPIFDDVRVPFEEGGELWTAVLDGALMTDGRDPVTLVMELQRSGKIGRALDRSTGIATVPIDACGPVLTADIQQRVLRIDRHSAKREPPNADALYRPVKPSQMKADM